MNTPTKFLSGLFLFIASFNYTYSQSLVDKSKLVMQDNELQRSKAGQDANFYCNPLVLNGQSLDYSNFTINSKGQLAVVAGDPLSAHTSKVPFYISLRRNGKIVEDRRMDFLNKPVYSIEISNVLSFSRTGDQLIITPATDWKAKRILKIIS
jgi:hypothetical protein